MKILIMKETLKLTSKEPRIDLCGNVTCGHCGSACEVRKQFYTWNPVLKRHGYVYRCQACKRDYWIDFYDPDEVVIQ